MKKIYPIFEIIFYISLILLLSLVVFIFFIKCNSKIFLEIIAIVCIIHIIAFILKLFTFPSHIIIGDIVKVFDYPLLATNKFYVKKSGLIDYNSKIFYDEIAKIEIVKLMKKDKKKYVGYVHFFSKYLKICLKHGNAKYVYVGLYSNYQIKKIIKLINIYQNVYMKGTKS